ncbi:unnamed protein product [Ceratitis capitata]|uniref:(Mediterranean fruit fly) hypothetical protein n=1 Tax=Ceratitis capitata TaxID=7213 RepID=A0A811UMS7_CERCA|nr:unnamed protein product [Ceratitis capitata]
MSIPPCIGRSYERETSGNVIQLSTHHTVPLKVNNIRPIVLYFNFYLKLMMTQQNFCGRVVEKIPKCSLHHQKDAVNISSVASVVTTVNFCSEETCSCLLESRKFNTACEVSPAKNSLRGKTHTGFEHNFAAMDAG